ncbi:GPI-anchored cell wall organization protein Ecm33 [Geosmithia morbida]|uniref:GPI-anchored cell wall organization protein Ecm33 n=1 Tax=Geosmithia morbida TaxID=1094350 RepID=A0A9P4YR69_9HYPO|nr:GPI-anchored cell wall organization protein Ecm33 [Geosmithia morbida]KAF4121077.1 GPI-anchored cell wall organization protein Ecm33 [Geosmithia morbida]
MHSAKTFAAVAAFAATAFAATCKDVTIETTGQAISCDTITGDLTVDEALAGDLTITGPKTIKGDLIVNNATNLLSLTSSTISSIEGRFVLTSLNSLNTISMDNLRTIGNLEMQKLPALRDLIFGTEGVTKASQIEVSDTFLSSLSGLKISSVDSLNINNNDRLTKFESDLVNITDTLIITSNGRDMEISMQKLESAAEIQIANVKSFQAPLLSNVSASLKFDKCDELKSFSAPNLTSVKDAVSFINNKKLTNISFPILKTIGGDLRIVNNTLLKTIDGFPKFESCASINFGGNFNQIKLPSLDSVGGTAQISTTTQNSTVCDDINDADDDGKIKGGAKCTYDNENANEGGDKDGGETGSGSSSSDSSSDDDDSAAGMVAINSALIGLGLIAGVAQLL